MSNIFQKIGSGFMWVVKEIGAGFSDVPKLITLTSDAEKIASDSIPNVVAVLNDVKDLATATVKDGGAFVRNIAGIGIAFGQAVQNKGIDINSDEAVVAAVKALLADFNAEQVADIVAAWTALVVSADTFDNQVITDVQKLEKDAA